MAYSYDRRASALLSPEYLAKLISKLDPMLVAEAPMRLERLRKDLANGGLDPFPIAELGDFLRDWRVDEDEIEHVLSIKIQAPRKKRRGKTFFDAYDLLNKTTGVSIIHDARLEHDPEAIPAVEAWAKGFRKMKPKAKTLFKQLVKKIRIGRPHGSEDASWLVGGTMALSIKQPLDANSAASFMTHELGHAVEEAFSVRHWESPWGEPPFVSPYAEFKPHAEDFAESFRVFIERPSELRKVAPAKYDRLKQIV